MGDEGRKDDQEKIRFELLPGDVLRAIAIILTFGAIKYAPRNWEKGIPCHCYLDSGPRHYLKFIRGDSDEAHDRAFVWNMLGAFRTHKDLSSMIDLPFKIEKELLKNEKTSDNE